MSGVKIYNKDTGRWEVVATSNSKEIEVTNANVESNNVDGAIGEISKKYDDLKKNVAWIYENGGIGGGGGGGGDVSKGKIVISITQDPYYVSSTDFIVVNYMVEARGTSNFYVTLRRGQQTGQQVTVRPNTWYSWNVGVLPKGNHTLFFSGVDTDQMPIDSATLNVVSGALEITSTFDDRAIFNVSSNIRIPYQVSSFLTTPINIETSINLAPQPTLTDVPQNIVQDYVLGQRPVGVYNVVMQAFSSGYTSNKLEFTINVASTSDLFLSVGNNIQTTYNKGIPIKFVYTIAVLGYTAFVTDYTINGKSGQFNSVLGSNIFELPTDDLPPGTHKLILNARDADSTIFTKQPLEIDITITEGDFVPWEAVQSGLIAHFRSRGIDSSVTDRWENRVVGSKITCDLFGINGSSNGFIGSNDPNDIEKSLSINGESYAKINYKPFSQDNQVLTNGLTINVLYKTENIGNIQARVIDCGSYNPITDILTYGFFTNTEDSQVKTIRTSAAAKVAEDEWINQTFVVDDKFLKVYNNGVLTAIARHGGFLIDDISHDGNIYLGAREVVRLINGQNVNVITDFADCFIKEVKIYNRALTSEEVVYNYVGDEYYLHTVLIDGVLQFDVNRQMALRALNSFDENGQFKVDTTATSPFPIVDITFTDNTVAAEFREYSERTVWGSNDDRFKKFPCIINYSDHENRRYLINHPGYISLQGTSSTQYTSKNYDIFFGVMNDGNTDFLFSPKVDWLPENNFTLKCDMMDSSHANNVGTGRLINDGLFRQPIPPKVDPNNVNRDKIRDAIDGFPSILTIAMGRVDENGDEDNYMGIYMFNMGRQTYYNLGLKNYEFDEVNGTVTSYVDKPTGLYAPNNCFAYEVSTSNNDGAGAFKQYSDEWLNAEFNRIYPINANIEAFNQLRNVVSKTSNSGTPVVVTDLQGNPVKDEFGNDVMTPGGLQFTEQSVWNLPSLADYLVLAYVLGMVDNLGKNMMLKTWEKVGAAMESVWYATFYDMDTILGLDNVGNIVHPPSLDMDAYPTGNFVVDHNNPDNIGRGDYNLSRSRLWELYKRFYYEFETRPENEPISFHLKQRYFNLRRSGVLTYENIISKYMSIIESIGQNYYNKDAEIKYLNEFPNDNGDIGYHNLTFLHGTREHYTKLWIKRRLTYLDSLFDTSSNQIDGNTASKGLMFRFNVGSASIGNRIINVKTYSPTWVTAMWSGEDDPNDFSKLLVTADDFTTFQKTFSAGTQSTNLNFGPEIMYLNDINVGNPSYLNLANASGLIQLDLSGNRYLQAINLDGCVSLRNLDLRNCTRLGEGASEDPRTYIDVSSCINLQNMDISNTRLSQVSLPSGGTLKTLTCYSTLITSLDLSNQSFLEEVDLSNCTNLNSITLVNCANIKRIVLTNTALTSFQASNCPNLEEVILSNSSRLTSVNFASTPNVKILDLSGCNNASFTELNLIGCPILEDLNLTSCTARLIRFANTLPTLKRFICRNSSIEQTQFGGTAPNTFNNKPAVNMSQFTALTSLDFYSCQRLINVTNFNLTLNSPNSCFYSCSNLERITGNLKINGSATNTFAYCSKLILNPEVKNSSGVYQYPADNANLQFNLDLSSCTSLNSAFSNTDSITLYDVYYVLRRASNATNLTSCFFNSRGIVTNDQNPIPSNLFEKCVRATNVTQIFYTNNRMTGPLPAALFRPMVNLTIAYRAFSGCKFTTFDQSFFAYNTKLTDIRAVLNDNSINSTVFGKNLFVFNTELTTIASAFSNNTNFSVVLEDDTLFRFNPKLTNASGAFANCNVTGQLHENIFGGKDATKVGVEDGVMVTYNYPVNLTDITNIFVNTKITGVFSKDLFTNNTKLQYVTRAFSGTNIAGAIPAGLFETNVELIGVDGFFRNLKITGDIPADLFANNKKLTNVSELFFNCNELTSTIPETLFTNCPKLTNTTSLFQGAYNLRGVIPNDLFKCKDELGFEVPLNITSGGHSMFRGCYGLSGPLPEGLFRYMPNITDLSYTFYDCGSINRTNEFGLTGSIPDGLLHGLFQLKSINYMFYRCNKLTYKTIEPENPLDDPILEMIPKDFFRDNPLLTDATYAFSYLTNASYGQIPLGLLDPLTSLTTASYMFYTSMRSQELDRDLFKFNNRLTNISYIFSNDSANDNNTWDKAIPDGLFTPYTTGAGGVSGQPLRNVTSAFAKNTALKGNSIKFWEFGTVTERSQCYRNCTSLNDYDSIPAEYK